METPVSEYKATMSITGPIINNGDNVAFKTSDDEVGTNRMGSCYYTSNK